MRVSLDFNSEEPLYTQLRNQIVTAIGTGELELGERLPTVRQLAQDLGINPMTVNKAYAQLKAEGFLEMDRRRGAAVSDGFLSAGGGYEPYRGKLERELKLTICEAFLRGMNAAEFHELCTSIIAGLRLPKPLPEMEGN
ncbi:GntR family transcriptional regulator [Gorillibacterium sp. CAU 1737]|uniref:GntR family transcriptional regulator n=1 Tax=Gorillibacterium sp. CAU 1737 TaxID=3140362 RepID=UPI00326049C8